MLGTPDQEHFDLETQQGPHPCYVDDRAAGIKKLGLNVSKLKHFLLKDVDGDARRTAGRLAGRGGVGVAQLEPSQNALPRPFLDRIGRAPRDGAGLARNRGGLGRVLVHRELHRELEVMSASGVDTRRRNRMQ